jgi:hypothetical protein
VKGSAEWLVLLPGRLPAYISEDEYGANIARLTANQQTAATPGPPRGRGGAAVRAAALRPQGRAPHVGPLPGRQRHGKGALGSRLRVFVLPGQLQHRRACQHVSGPALDGYVASRVLEAVAPAALEVSMAAASQAEDERAMLGKLWRQRLERACYAADRARRQCQLAEPENRLVARQLEAGWEAALAEAARLEADCQRFTEERPAVLTTAERTAIQALAGDRPRVWHAPATTQADRKELLRILIQDIIVNVAGDSEIADVTITWAGGHQSAGQAVRRQDQLSYFAALLARVTDLAEAGRRSRQIADALNAKGFRPPKRSSRFIAEQVRALTTRRGIRRQPKGRTAALASLPTGHWSVLGLAAELGTPPPRSTPGSTAAGSPPAAPPEASAGSSQPTTGRYGNYASAGHARAATTSANDGTPKNLSPITGKGRNHEKQRLTGASGGLTLRSTARGSGRSRSPR